MPWYDRLLKKCAVSDTDIDVIQELKERLRNGLQDKIRLTHLHYIASFLHPSFKDLGMLSTGDRRKTLEDVRAILNTLSLLARTDRESDADDDEGDAVCQSDKRGKFDLASEYLQERISKQSRREKTDEISLYDKLPLTKLPEDHNVMQWWHSAEHAYPALRTHALMVLAVPASSASSERLFSAAGRVLEKRRQSLSAKSVDAILFVRCNTANELGTNSSACRASTSNELRD